MGMKLQTPTYMFRATNEGICTHSCCRKATLLTRRTNGASDTFNVLGVRTLQKLSFQPAGTFGHQNEAFSIWEEKFICILGESAFSSIHKLKFDVYHLLSSKNSQMQSK